MLLSDLFLCFHSCLSTQLSYQLVFIVNTLIFEFQLYLYQGVIAPLLNYLQKFCTGYSTGICCWASVFAEEAPTFEADNVFSPFTGSIVTNLGCVGGVSSQGNMFWNHISEQTTEVPLILAQVEAWSSKRFHN